MKVPSVAIVGRPNVGKSTIFNKLIGKKVSIIEDTPGVTRDRIYGTVTHNNYKFHLIDTGGIDVSEEDFNDEIIIQANIAIEEAEINTICRRWIRRIKPKRLCYKRYINEIRKKSNSSSK